MPLRIWFFTFLLLCAQTTTAQRTKYIQPEFTIQWTDTTTSLLQVVNYFDRSYYSKDIFLKEILANGTYGFNEIFIDTATGLGKLPNNLVGKRNIQIGRCFELENIELQSNKINRIEIRSEVGFINLRPTHYSADASDNTPLLIIPTGRTDTIRAEQDCIVALPMGKYILCATSTPPSTSTIYIKPSQILHSKLYQAVPVSIKDKKKFQDFTLSFANYPYEIFNSCDSGKTDADFERILLQPNKLYKIGYRKKGKRRVRYEKFYIRNGMKEFIVHFN